MKKALLSLFALFPALFCFAEYNQEYLVYQIIPGSDNICKLTGVDRTNVDKIKGKVVIPATTNIDGVEYELKSISNDALAYLPNITHVVIEQGKEDLIVGEYIFNNCSSLATVDFPENLFEIGRNSIRDCENLTTVICRSKSVPIVSGGSSDIIYLEPMTLYVPEESLNIYKSSNSFLYFWGRFGDYKTLESLEDSDNDGDDDGDDDNGGGEDPDDPEIPSSGEITIDASMIEYTLSGTELTINSFKLKDFSGKVTIPATIDIDGKTYFVKILNHHCFEDCTGITEIVAYANSSINYNVYSCAFAGCTNLRRVELPDRLYDLELSAFSGCPKLKTIYSESNLGVALSYNESDPIDLYKTAFFINPKDYDNFLAYNKKFVGLFGKVLTTDDLENVIFTYKNYSVEFLHMMRDHSFAFAGCQVSDEESDCFSIEGNSLTINAAGGFRINAAELPDRNSPARIVNDDSPVSTVKFGGATLTLSNVEAGHQFIMSVPQNEALAGYGCDFVRNADNTYTVTVADPQQFSVASMDGSLVGISDAECNDDSLKVYSDGQSISVIGASFDSPVKILDFQGRCIAVVAASGSVALPRGVYLVVTPKKTLKVIL